MTITYSQNLRQQYEQDTINRIIADRCFDILFSDLQEYTHINPAVGDRAENLVMAIYDYLLKSQSELHNRR